MKHIYCSAAVAAAALAACSDSPKTDAEYRAEVVATMQSSIAKELTDLIQAATDLQAAAPTHRWTDADAAAITTMKAAWRRARVAYEHVEGATAPIFPELDFTMDARYDDYMTALAPNGDANLFDGAGVTGMHGIERILFTPTIRTEVIAGEQTLPGYRAAAFPATDADAMSFKTVLCKKLIDDATALHDGWTPAKIDIDFAFDGLIGLMNEQGEKVDLAATGEEESRYANITLFDLHNNLDGTKQIYELFRGWIKSRSGGPAADQIVIDRFVALTALYMATPGDSLPAVPDNWSSDAPSPADLQSPFGMLWKTVRDSVDPDTAGSVVFEMQHISSDVLALKQPPPE